MKLFNGVTGRAVIAGLGLLAAAGMANAYDTETDTIEVITAVSELSADPGGFAIRMSTPETLGTGLCSDGWINVEFTGESSKVLYQSMIAANSGGRTVTVHYVNDSGSCNLAYTVVH
jgi:hypothetical protein